MAYHLAARVGLVLIAVDETPCAPEKATCVMYFSTSSSVMPMPLSSTVMSTLPVPVDASRSMRGFSSVLRSLAHIVDKTFELADGVAAVGDKLAEKDVLIGIEPLFDDGQDIAPNGL
jgi:hypothetical protein